VAYPSPSEASSIDTVLHSFVESLSEIDHDLTGEADSETSGVPTVPLSHLSVAPGQDTPLPANPIVDGGCQAVQQLPLSALGLAYLRHQRLLPPADATTPVLVHLITARKAHLRPASNLITSSTHEALRQKASGAGSSRHSICIRRVQWRISLWPVSRGAIAHKVPHAEPAASVLPRLSKVRSQ